VTFFLASLCKPNRYKGFAYVAFFAFFFIGYLGADDLFSLPIFDCTHFRANVPPVKMSFFFDTGRNRSAAPKWFFPQPFDKSFVFSFFPFSPYFDAKNGNRTLYPLSEIARSMRSSFFDKCQRLVSLVPCGKDRPFHLNNPF